MGLALFDCTAAVRKPSLLRSAEPSPSCESGSPTVGYLESSAPLASSSSFRPDILPRDACALAIVVIVLAAVYDPEKFGRLAAIWGALNGRSRRRIFMVAQSMPLCVVRAQRPPLARFQSAYAK